MFLDTLCVNTKVKLAWPSAGREMPSIFCSTHGPRSVFVVVPAVMTCHGQANLTVGRCTLRPRKCSVAASAVSTTDAIARRKMNTAAASTKPILPNGPPRNRRGPRARRGSGR